MRYWSEDKRKWLSYIALTGELGSILCQYFGAEILFYGLLARCIKLRFAHAPRMPGTYSPPPRRSDPDMHLGMCWTHVPWCLPRSLTSGFLWNRRRGKGSWHSRRMRNPKFYVSGKRPINSFWLYLAASRETLREHMFPNFVPWVIKKHSKTDAVPNHGKSFHCTHLRALLLTWFNFNPSMHN